MFKGWDFLLAEIWGLLALAVLLGLFVGWLIWGGRAKAVPDTGEVQRLQAELEREKARNRVQSSDPLDDVPAMQGGGYVRPTPPPPAAKPAPVAPVQSSAQPAAATKPQGLSAPRDGLADDLTKISGIGPKMEKLCNDLGFWHYEQIANWTADEIAWVDENLEGFKGRVTRDAWVDQAKAMATPQTPNDPSPAFVRRRD